jgi:hypothetical protein
LTANPTEAFDLELLSPGEEELRARYDAYRLRQARALVRMLPRDVIRPMYRRALSRDSTERVGSPDPLAALLRYCEELLPLPPFEVWRDDAKAHPEAHLRDLDDSADAPTAIAPATLEARRVEHAGDTWIAHLRSFRDSDAWRGHIAFEQQPSGRVHRTALIFREQGPAEVRERFLSFEPDTLQAFLRSALP